MNLRIGFTNSSTTKLTSLQIFHFLQYFFCGIGMPHCMAKMVYTSPSCSSGAATYTLTWGGASGQALWAPAGSLVDTFKNVADSGHDFSFSFSGDTDDFAFIGSGNTPNIQTFFSGGAKNLLSLYVNPPLGNSSVITPSHRYLSFH